jgi:hypothetical protein
MVGRILRALFYHYIKQRAKQTLKKQDNSSSTMSLQKDLTTEPRGTTIPTYLIDTSEKIIMNATTEDIVAHVREWSLDRAADKNVSIDDARAILAEFYEWIDPDESELEIISIEPQS